MDLPATTPAPAPAFADSARRLLWTFSSRAGLILIGGHPESSRLSHYFLAAPLLKGETVLFLDAANCFNPYRVTSFAVQCRRLPAEFLGRIRISRAFTCFQLAELIERTPTAARRYRARHVVVTGMPDIFDDEELPPAEVKAVFTRALASLRGWPGQGLTALIFSDAPAASAPARPLGLWLARALTRQVTAAYLLEESATGLTLVGQTEGPGPVCHPEGLIALAPRDLHSNEPRKMQIPRSAQNDNKFNTLLSARKREVDYGTHGRHLSSTDRAEPGALRQVPPRPAARRPAGVR